MQASTVVLYCKNLKNLHWEICRNIFHSIPVSPDPSTEKHFSWILALVMERVPWGWTYSYSCSRHSSTLFTTGTGYAAAICQSCIPGGINHNTMLELPLLPWIFHCDMAIVCNGDCSRRLCLHLLPYLSYEPGTGGLYHWLQNHHTSSFNESSKNPPEFW